MRTNMSNLLNYHVFDDKSRYRVDSSINGKDVDYPKDTHFQKPTDLCPLYWSFSFKIFTRIFKPTKTLGYKIGIGGIQ